MPYSQQLMLHSKISTRDLFNVNLFREAQTDLEPTAILFEPFTAENTDMRGDYHE